MTSKPDTQPTSAIPHHSKQSTTSTPPVNISSQAHLDPACYVKGSHPLTIEAGTIVHPRCRLYTDHGKVTIGSESMLLEKCVIGIDKELNPARKDDFPDAYPAVQDSESSKNVVIGSRVSLHSAVKIQPPCTIGEGTILEAGVVLLPGCEIGAHSKVCAGVTLPPGTSVPDWTVVYGIHGQMRRKRTQNVTEDSRLEGFGRERSGVETLLKVNVTKSVSSAGGGSRNKRESMIRTESSKG